MLIQILVYQTMDTVHTNLPPEVVVISACDGCPDSDCVWLAQNMMHTVVHRFWSHNRTWQATCDRTFHSPSAMGASREMLTSSYCEMSRATYEMVLWRRDLHLPRADADAQRICLGHARWDNVCCRARSHATHCKSVKENSSLATLLKHSPLQHIPGIPAILIRLLMSQIDHPQAIPHPVNEAPAGGSR